MQIVCPNCGFSRDVPREKIPATATKATCPKCKTKFTFDGEIVELGQPAPQPPREEAEHPEPPREEPKPPRVEPEASEPEPGEPVSAEPAEPEEPAPTEDTPPSPSGNEAPAPWQPVSMEQEEPAEEARPGPHAPEADEVPSHPVSTEPKEEDEDRAPPRRPDSEGEQRGDIWHRLESMDLPEDEPPLRGSGGQSGSGRERERERTHWEPVSEAPPSVAPPWEQLNEFGFFKGLWETITRVMFHPTLFFEAMPLGKGVLRPLAFYVLVSLLSYLLSLPWVGPAWEHLSQGVNSPAMQDMASGLNSSLSAPILSVLVRPFMDVIQIFFLTSVIHVSLVILQAAKGGFEGTFRVMAYSVAPTVLFVVPFLGVVAAVPWSFFILIRGLRAVHQTGFGQVILGLLLPLLALVAIATTAFSLAPGAA